MHGTPITQMRSELTDAGVKELTTAQEVSDYFTKETTALLVFNSVCGCAAGSARPGVVLALEGVSLAAVSVFAGQDPQATAKAREIFSQYKPSSPSCLLIVAGEVKYQLLREEIMGHTPEEVATLLQEAFKTHLN